QQPVVVADAGDAAAAAGAAVDGDELAEHVAVADHQFGALAGELLVLRLAADGHVADEAVLAADAGRAAEAAVRADLAAVTDLHVRPDHGEGAHADARAQAGGGIDHGGGMDQGVVVHWLGPLLTRGCRHTALRHRRPLPRRPWLRRSTRPCCGSRA